MEKFISYEKLSKKKQRELNRKKRETWGVLNPVTRKTKNEKVYNRKKARNWKDAPDLALFSASVYKSEFVNFLQRRLFPATDTLISTAAAAASAAADSFLSDFMIYNSDKYHRNNAAANDRRKVVLNPL